MVVNISKQSRVITGTSCQDSYLYLMKTRTTKPGPKKDPTKEKNTHEKQRKKQQQQPRRTTHTYTHSRLTRRWIRNNNEQTYN